MTFSRRSSAFIANARVSATRDAEAASLVLAALASTSAEHAVGDGPDLDQRALDGVAVARVALRHVAQEARAERDVAVLVARDLA